MPHDPEQHARRSLHLQGYNYSQAGAYFVTICTHNRKCLFGEVVGGEMRINSSARIVQVCWDDLPRHYGRVELDAFVIMPNHVHGIIVLADPEDVGAGFKPAHPTRAGLKPAPTSSKGLKRHGLPEIVRAFKTFSAHHINRMRYTTGMPVWQRSYYEHVIRNEETWTRIRQYIADNPKQWETDPENPRFNGKFNSRQRRRGGFETHRYRKNNLPVIQGDGNIM